MTSTPSPTSDPRQAPETGSFGEPDPSSLTVVMLAYGSEEHLVEAVDAVLASRGVALELVLVDNGTTNPAVDELGSRQGVRLLRPAENLGFTGGVNLGLAEASSEFVAMVNSDAIVDPDALARLVGHLEQDPAVGIAGALVLLADAPDTVNSSGNPLHVVGLSWAGDLGRPAAEIPAVARVASASGACLVLRTSLWRELDGFPEEFFAYLEDMDLCWRTWQHGLRVEVVAEAKVWHHYEFGRNPLKMYLLERNRLLFLATVHERRTLVALALPAAAFEVAITALSAAQGWPRQKARGWRWAAGHHRWIRDRRKVVQAQRRVADRELLALLTTDVAPGMAVPAVTPVLEKVLAAYWAMVRRLL